VEKFLDRRTAIKILLDAFKMYEVKFANSCPCK